MSFVLVAINCFILITGYVYLSDARIPWPLQGHGWIALLGVLSFLFIILRFFLFWTSSRSWMNCTIGCTIFFIYYFAFFFILCFLVTFLGMNFCSVYFFYGFLIIALSMKNCSEFIIRILFKCSLLFFI